MIHRSLCTTQALHKKWTNLQGQSELSKEDLVLVVGYKLTRGKMRPLMRFAEAMHDNEVRKAVLTRAFALVFNFQRFGRSARSCIRYKATSAS